MKPILEIENVSKRFQIHHQDLPYLSFREKLIGLFNSHEKKEEFWALKDVSFKVEAGQSVGIIGKNGAGKSTLLKILSRITPPTNGRIISRGRIASLLEVGTGFHQELTGKENIYMNGSILGMKKVEIDRRFDEIVDFSGTERFLDTPLKHYSSGMQLRLAFAVAAYLNPEILIIDEVLAVGDSEFQKKCMGKMHDVTRQGKTVLFVSHNMSAVEQLCTRGLLFKSGYMVKDETNVGKLVNFYLSEGAPEGNATLEWNESQQLSNDYHTITRFALQDESNHPYMKTIHYSSAIWVHIEGTILQPHPGLNIGYAVYNSLNNMLYWSYCNDHELSYKPTTQAGKFALKTQIPARYLNQGSYRIELVSVIHNSHWLMEPGSGLSLNFEIADGFKDVTFTPKFQWLNGRAPE